MRKATTPLTRAAGQFTRAAKQLVPQRRARHAGKPAHDARRAVAVLHQGSATLGLPSRDAFLVHQHMPVDQRSVGIGSVEAGIQRRRRECLQDALLDAPYQIRVHMARAAQECKCIAGQAMPGPKMTRPLAVQILLPDRRTDLRIDDHVLDQRVEGLRNQVAPTVPVAGLGHPYRGQYRARVAPQRFVCGVVLIALYDCMQAIREVASTRLHPGEQKSGTVSDGADPRLFDGEDAVFGFADVRRWPVAVGVSPRAEP